MAWGTAFRKVGLVVALGALAACSTTAGAEDPVAHAKPASPAAAAGITKINHIVVMMQENRSYDSYF